GQAEPANAPSIEEIIVMTLPSAHGQRNRALFTLARHLRARFGELSKCMPIVKEWHEIAAASDLIETKDFDVTRSDFAYAWASVKFAYGEGRTDAVIEAASQLPTPKCADDFGATTTLLVKVCMELQRNHSDRQGNFFLSCRK